MSEDLPPDPNTFMALRQRMYALQERCEQLVKEAQGIAREVADLATDLLVEAEPGVGTLKRPDGRLNEAGIRAIESAFANGMGVADAAKTFGISASAASTRRKVWQASRAEVGQQPEGGNR